MRQIRQDYTKEYLDAFIIKCAELGHDAEHVIKKTSMVKGAGKLDALKGMFSAGKNMASEIGSKLRGQKDVPTPILGSLAGKADRAANKIGKGLGTYWSDVTGAGFREADKSKKLYGDVIAQIRANRVDPELYDQLIAKHPEIAKMVSTKVQTGDTLQALTSKAELVKRLRAVIESKKPDPLASAKRNKLSKHIVAGLDPKDPHIADWLKQLDPDKYEEVLGAVKRQHGAADSAIGSELQRLYGESSKNREMFKQRTQRAGTATGLGILGGSALLANKRDND